MTRPQSRVAVERTMMTPLCARRLAAHLRALRAIGVLAVMAFATVARADAVDDTLAKFLDDKFPQTAAAIGELSAEAPPQAAAILEALADNRLLIDQADKIVAYKTAAAAALKLAEASIFATSDTTTTQDRLSAIASLKERGDQDAQSLIDGIAQKATGPAVKSAAESALSAIHARLALWSVAQNLWYGISASSVLLLAAIGLAITFGVMGVINMAHGESVVLGAYSAYVVQSPLPPSLQNWSLAFAIPLAFVVAGVVGIAIERLVIRFLYTRPLETLLATWGVALILPQ